MVQAWLWADLNRLVAEDSPKHYLCLSIADDLGLHAGQGRLTEGAHRWPADWRLGRCLHLAPHGVAEIA